MNSDPLADVMGETPRAEINLATIEANYLALKSFAASAETSAVVKADAYGHGAAQVAARLQTAGCTTFFVAYPHEGVAVRDAIGPGSDIFILHGPTAADISLFSSAALIPVCNSVEQLELWLRAGIKMGYALHFDTGMNRLGIRPESLTDILQLTGDKSPLLVMSHLACADAPGHEMNASQLERFKSIAAHFPDSKKSLSATAGIYLGSDYHFDLVRLGIGIYGGGPARPPEVRTRPALKLTAPILSVFDVKEGETTGYGASFTARRPTQLATVALGYADGYLRSASNYGFGILDGTPCPVVGRISMDMTTVDISDLPERPELQTHIEFIGPHAGLEIQAEALGTLDYELTSRLGGRISRVWTD
ncbi:alanine racemase [Ponticaulis sp.]|uniref:alanine racemase n=1 Tax=Ponticaulis sp. TaxID=2020902 RepID=UPI000B6D3F92|nr:alanine racemase [Ponticaulis sp.]MAI91946.1 alanine racemase [Ponticaulis sp.]OUX96418.1 MAG: alanine racemase [Hyphomonadaceae bacterium TMED5]